MIATAELEGLTMRPAAERLMGFTTMRLGKDYTYAQLAP